MTRHRRKTATKKASGVERAECNLESLKATISSVRQDFRQLMVEGGLAVSHCVRRWSSGDMIPRWMATSVFEVENGFRSVERLSYCPPCCLIEKTALPHRKPYFMGGCCLTHKLTQRAVCVRWGAVMGHRMGLGSRKEL